MKSILINIDSNNAIFDYNINITNIKYIKLKDANISNEFNIYDKIFNNNYFTIICNLIGPPPGINVFTIPSIEITITIPYYIYNITKLLIFINTELYNNKLNNYNNNYADKGIYFDIIDNNIIIKNLSKHYECILDFSNNSKYDSFGRYLGFKYTKYNIELNTSIISEYTCNNYYDSIYIKINDYSTIYRNSDTPIGFCKLIYNKQTNEYYNKIEFIYTLVQYINITNLHIELVNINGNSLIFNNNFSFILELGYTDLYDINDIYNMISLNNNLLNDLLNNKNNSINLINEKLDKSINNIKIIDTIIKSSNLFNNKLDEDLTKVDLVANEVNEEIKPEVKLEVKLNNIINEVVNITDNNLDNNKLEDNIKHINKKNTVNNKLLFPINSISILNSIKKQNIEKFTFDY